MMYTINRQKGVSLIITFFIMAIMLAIILSVSTILFSEVKIISNTGNSLSSFYAANSGLEKTLYFDRKQIPLGGNRGLCNICNVCGLSSCNNCTTVPLTINGCSLISCTNCRVTYSSVFDGRNYTVDAKVSPDIIIPNSYTLDITSKGFYRDTTRVIKYTAKNLAQNDCEITGNIAGPNFPSTAVDNNAVGTITWTNPSNVTVDDGVNSIAFLAGFSAVSHYLKATGFGFNIPSNSTVNGILVEWEKFNSVPGGNIFDNSVKIVKGGTVVGSQKAKINPWGYTPAYSTYGSSTDLWGVAWTPADINNSNFGAVMSAKSGASFINQANLDAVRITVYYACTP